MAIEDAEALGYLFRDVRLPILLSMHAPSPEITKRLAIFQSLRMDRTQIVQVTSCQLGGLLEGEVKEKAGEYDCAAFYKRIIGYAGFEAVYEAYLAEGIIGCWFQWMHLNYRCLLYSCDFYIICELVRTWQSGI